MNANRLPALLLTDPEAIDRLGDDLRAAGFEADHVPERLGVGPHNALARGHRWPALHATRDGSPLSTLIRLFLLGTTESERAARGAFPELGIGRAVAQGVLEPYGDGIRAGLDIRPHADDESSFLVVSDLDSDVRPGPVRPDHVLGIGAASITLARAVIRDPVQRTIDVGTGCGIQALHCFSHSTAVTATDTNPRALVLAAATARLNGQRWDLRQGSLFDPVSDDRFDLIVSNPPFVISSGAQRFSYRDSGMAGDELCRRLITGIGDHLTDGGTAQILANWLVPDRADWRERVGGWVSATGCDAWVVQREVADPAEYVSLWLADSGEAGTPEAAETAGEWLDYFSANHVVGVGMGTVILRRSGASQPDVVLDELTAPGDEVTGSEAAAFLARREWLRGRSDADLLATRFALAPGDMLENRALPGHQGWSTVLRRLQRPGGPGAVLQLDEWGEALLGGCTGEVPLELQLRLLAAAHGVDEDALTAAVLPAIRTAVTRGLLHQVQH
jgi:methylase of polypeptide subunit release factors